MKIPFSPLAAILTTICAAGCASSPHVEQPEIDRGTAPPSIHLQCEPVFSDARIAYITDLHVDLAPDGSPRQVIVLGTGGCALLGPDLKLREFHAFPQSRSNPGLVDLGEKTIALERGNSVFLLPIVARSLDGTLLWSTQSPLKPTDFADLWIHPFVRGTHARLLVGVKGRSQVAVLDEQGQFDELIPWDRVNSSREMVFADVNGDGEEDAVFGSGGSLVARDSHGTQLFRVEFPLPAQSHSPYVSQVAAVETATNAPPTFFVLFYSQLDSQSGVGVPQNYRVQIPKNSPPQVEEVSLDTPIPWAGPQATFGDGIGETRVTTIWEGMGILVVRIWQPDGKFLGQHIFHPGYAPGGIAVFRARGDNHDTLLVGANNIVWRVDAVHMAAQPPFTPVTPTPSAPP